MAVSLSENRKKNETDYLLWEEEIEADTFLFPLSDSHAKQRIPAPIRKIIGKAHNSLVGQIRFQAFTTATYDPHQRLNIDTIGPSPPDADGNCYILVLIDTFTRWIEHAIKTVKALEAAKVLLQHFGRFGQAQQLQSDNGTQFVNAIITELCLLIGVEHKRTLAYSSEENAIVEANQEVLRHLRTIIHSTKVLDTCNLFLPFVQRIMNAAVSQTTGVSPAQLLFGYAITLDRSILVDLPIDVKQDLSEWANEMVKASPIFGNRLSCCISKVADDTNDVTKRQKMTPTVFNEGALVFCRNITRLDSKRDHLTRY